MTTRLNINKGGRNVNCSSQPITCQVEISQTPKILNSNLTHDLCNQQAIKILKNDGLVREAQALARGLPAINAGSEWADSQWKSISHFYNPVFHSGFCGWPSAVQTCSQYCQLAAAYGEQDFDQAMFYIGAAVHLVQDLCVPHHAKGVMFNGHLKYEKWAEANSLNYLIDSNGCYYDEVQNAGHWIVTNARISYDLYSLVKTANTRSYHLATRTLLPLAQQTSAGFLKFFINRCGISTLALSV